MNLILLGAPGSGKGTQAEQLQGAFQLTHLASGDLFRENLDMKTPLGVQAAAYMNRGALVPDEVTVAMVGERLRNRDTENGVIFDGFPRTLAQADALDRMMEALGRRIDGALFIHVPDAELIERLSSRLICRECQAPFHRIANPFRVCHLGKCRGEHLYRRDDDHPDTVRVRLATFHDRTGALVERWKQQGRLVIVPGSGPIAEVTKATLAAATALKVNSIKQ